MARTQKAEAGEICEFKANLVYVVSRRPIRATYRDPVSNQKSRTLLLCLRLKEVEGSSAKNMELIEGKSRTLDDEMFNLSSI